MPASRGRQQSVGQVSHIGSRPSRARGTEGLSRSRMRSRAIETNRWSVPGVAARSKRRPSLPGRLGGLRVEVPGNFEVVGDEADRADHHTAHAGVGERSQVVVDVGLEPRYLERAGPGLPDQVPRHAVSAGPAAPPRRRRLGDECRSLA